MKKAIILVLALVLALSLAACGEKDNTGSTGGNTPGTSQGGNDTTPSNNGGNATGDLTTVKGFLSAFGLTENDLKCANFTRLDKTAYVSETKEITEVGAYISKALTDEEAKAWLEQIITKLNSLSADGKITNSHAKANGEALTVDFMLSADAKVGGGSFGGGSYTYNGKKVNVTIAVKPSSLDNEDPDEATAACTLELKWQ